MRRAWAGAADGWPARLEKVARLLAQAPMFEAGQVLLPREAPWLGTYLAELLAFPNGKHDDQVDSTSQALNWLSKKIALGVPPRRPNPSDRRDLDVRRSGHGLALGAVGRNPSGS